MISKYLQNPSQNVPKHHNNTNKSLQIQGNMSYYIEIWLRGFAKDYLRELSENQNESYHPHITLVRPFQILTNEEQIKETIIKICKNTSPIPFTIEGEGNFNNKINYIPITNSKKLLEFNNTIEKELEKQVLFAPKLNAHKILMQRY